MIRRSQRQFVFNLVRAFDLMVAPSGRPDGDDDEDTEDDSDKDDTSDGDDTDTGGDGDGKKVDNPEAKKASEEAAKHRVRAKDALARAEAAEKRLQELDDKDKSELEKAVRDAEEARERADKAEARVKKQAVKLAFFESGAHAQFRNAATALRLMDLSEVELDEDGEVDVKAVKDLAEALAKAEPYLLKDGSEEDTGDSDQPPSGRPPKKKGKKVDAERDVLVKKFPALQGR